MFSFCIGFKDWKAGHLLSCLHSIERLRTPGDELIVCDLGSTPDSLEIVFQLTVRSGGRFVYSPSPDWSRSEALNRAAAEARQPWLVLTDADSVFPTFWVAAAGAAILDDVRLNGASASPLHLTRSRDIPRTAMTEFCEPFAGRDDDWLLARTTEHPEVGQGAAMLALREWFQRVGGFDETYRTWGCDDTDLALRAEWDTGHPTPWIPDAWVAHQWHSRAWGNTPEIAAQVRKNREYLAARVAERGPIVRNPHLPRESHGDHAAR